MSSLPFSGFQLEKQRRGRVVAVRGVGVCEKDGEVKIRVSATLRFATSQKNIS